MPLKGPIARATIRTSGVLGLRLLVQAGTLLLVARMLGPRDFGTFAGVSSLAVMLGTLATFGTHTVLLAEVSRTPLRRAAVLPFALSTTLICGSLLFVLYLLLATNVPGVAGTPVQILISLGLSELLLLPLLNLPSAEHQGHGRIAISQLLTTLPLALRLLAAIGVSRLHVADPLRDYAYGYLGASALALLVATLSLRQAWPPLRDWRLPRPAELRHAAAYAVLNLTAASPTELDKTLAMRLLPLIATGVYAAGTRVIGALTLPVIAMMLASLPRLFRDGQSDPVRNSQLLQKVFAATLCYSLLLAALLWAARPLFPILFGPYYQDIGDAIRWLTLAVPGMALRIAAGSALMAIGNPWMRVVFELIGLTVLTLAASLLAPAMGLPGMALALACSEWTMALFGGIYIYQAAKNYRSRFCRRPEL